MLLPFEGGHPQEALHEHQRRLHHLDIEVENSIVMEGAHIDCGRRITDSIIGRQVRILNHETHLPRGHLLILGAQSTVHL